MEQHARKADGRRIYTPQFKREQLSRVDRGEVTLAELSRKLGISRSLLQRWKHPAQQATVAQLVGMSSEMKDRINSLCSGYSL